MDYHGNTNYSVVDIDLIDDLYRQMYQEKVLGTERLRFLNVSRLTDVKGTQGSVRATVQSLVTGEETPLDADIVVFATGYSPADPLGLLGEVADRCLRDDEGRVRVERDYRIATDPGLSCGIYLQGGTEHTHGITSALLSNTAIRVGEILDSLLDRGRKSASDEARPVADGTGSTAR
jgi:L-ornithine N5-oxygenase